MPTAPYGRGSVSVDIGRGISRYSSAEVVRLVAIALVTLLTAYADPAADVTRVLAENCLACHGPAKMSGLDLRTREGMLSGGKRGPAIVPGKASDSMLYKVIAHDGDLRMPPGKQSLDPAKVRLIRDWID